MKVPLRDWGWRKLSPYTRSPLITGHDLKRKRAHFVRKCWNLFSSHKYPSIYGTVTPEFAKRLERCRIAVGRWWTRAGCLYLLQTHWNHLECSCITGRHFWKCMKFSVTTAMSCLENVSTSRWTADTVYLHVGPTDSLSSVVSVVWLLNVTKRE